MLKSFFDFRLSHCVTLQYNQFLKTNDKFHSAYLLVLQNVHCEVSWHSSSGVRVSDGTSNVWSLITEYHTDAFSIGPIPCHRMSEIMTIGPTRVWRSSNSKSGPVPSEVVLIPSLIRKKLRAPACTFQGV